MVQQDSNKYIRTGYQSEGRHCDRLLATLLNELPGQDYLPKGWRYAGVDDFVDSYGHLGFVLWAESRTSHLLFVGGHKVLRVWTDAKNHCWVEGLAHIIFPFVGWKPIPPKNRRKSAPFHNRLRVTEHDQMIQIADRVKAIFGI